LSARKTKLATVCAAAVESSRILIVPHDVSITAVYTLSFFRTCFAVGAVSNCGFGVSASAGRVPPHATSLAGSACGVTVPVFVGRPPDEGDEVADADGEPLATGLSFPPSTSATPTPIAARPITAPTIPAAIRFRRWADVCSALRRAASFAS
jgi:hypothetical protein